MVVHAAFLSFIVLAIIAAHRTGFALANAAKDSPARLLVLEHTGFTIADETDKLL